MIWLRKNFWCVLHRCTDKCIFQRSKSFSRTSLSLCDEYLIYTDSSIRCHCVSISTSKKLHVKVCLVGGMLNVQMPASCIYYNEFDCSFINPIWTVETNKTKYIQWVCWYILQFCYFQTIFTFNQQLRCSRAC